MVLVEYLKIVFLYEFKFGINASHKYNICNQQTSTHLFQFTKKNKLNEEDNWNILKHTTTVFMSLHIVYF